MSDARDSDLVPLSDEKATLEILTKSVFGLWDTVNNLTRLRPTKRERYRVSIFGSARVDPNHWVYGAVRNLAADHVPERTARQALVTMLMAER